MSQSVNDILEIYDKLDKRGEGRVPVYTKEELYSALANPAIRDLFGILQEAVLEEDVNVHASVQDGNLVEAARANGMVSGLSMPLRWALEMKRFFKEEEEK